MSKNIGFTRWYDRIPELSQAVRQLEKASSDHQHLICQSVVHYNDAVLGHRTSTDGGLKKLGTQKVMGLLKSKSKRRWYDQDPLLHQAFNYLYMMDDTERYRVALRILVSLEAMQAASLHPQFAFRNVSDHTVAKSIVQGIFKQHLQYLIEKINFYDGIADKAIEELQQSHAHHHYHSHHEHVHGQPEVRDEDVLPFPKRKVIENDPQGGGMKIAARSNDYPIQTLI